MSTGTNNSSRGEFFNLHARFLRMCYTYNRKKTRFRVSTRDRAVWTRSYDTIHNVLSDMHLSDVFMYSLYLKDFSFVLIIDRFSYIIYTYSLKKMYQNVFALKFLSFLLIHLIFIFIVWINYLFFM